MSDVIVRDLTVEYRSGHYVVQPIAGLDLAVGSGELVLVLGPSGCGKTSLLSCLAGILAPASGTITVGELDVTALAGRQLAHYRRHGVGIVFQAGNLVPSLTAVENVAAPLRAAGVRGATATRRATDLLTTLGLADRARHRPGTMSGGQQQRVAIARALANDPRLIVADEPTAHLDCLHVDQVLRSLRDLARPGRAVVVSTHDSRLIPLADRVIDLTERKATPVRRGVARLRPGQVLFRQGDAGDVVYVVQRGEVELVCDRADGSEEVVGTATAGQYFGELAPLLGYPRSATARARTDCVVVAREVSEFRSEVPGGLTPRERRSRQPLRAGSR
ncbi:MAG: putative transport system ATP-binding protein [Actinomycetota bacterium]|jgi:putative ABC transport system ATP-binding protein